MLRMHHAPRTRVASRRHALAPLLVLGLATPALAQSAEPGTSTSPALAPPPTPTNPTALGVRAPTPDIAVAAFNAIEPWIRAWKAPIQPVSALAEPAAQGEVTAVMITLRHGGRQIAQAVAAPADEHSLWRATGDALAQATRALAPQPDATTQDLLESAADQVLISLQLAGPLIPLDAPTYAQADLQVNVGVEGVAARTNADSNDPSALVLRFPEQQLVSNERPGDALAAVTSRLYDEPNLRLRMDPENQPQHLRERRGTRYYHFRTTHLAQIAPCQAPIFLTRGSRIVASDAITSVALGEFRRALLTNLARRAALPAITGGLGGSFDPVAGKPLAQRDPLAMSISVLAICTAAAHAQGADERDAALALLVQPNPEARPMIEEAVKTPGPAAALVLAAEALRDLGLDTAAAPIPRASRATLAAAFSGGVWSENVPMPQRGLVAFALARVAARGGGSEGRSDRDVRADATAAVRSLFRETPRGELPTHLPWLLWAERELAGPDAPLPSTAALREVRDAVWKFQLTPDDTGTDAPDLVGGIVIPGSTPLPSAQSVRLIAALAALAADVDVTPRADLLREVARLVSGARFLRQLSGDTGCEFMYADPVTGRGGIRLATWDQHMPAEATALTLLAVLEIERTLDRVRAMPAPASNAPPPSAPR